MAKITNNGFKCKGIYVGRPSKFGNPYPTKKSKYNDKSFSLEESLKKYHEYFLKYIKNSKEFKELKNKYIKNGKIILNCWCINRTIESIEEIDIKNAKCHAEIIAFYLLKNDV